jgi:xanthine dehydrogenase small subunit
MTLRFVLNGEPTHVSAVSPQLSLLAYLRGAGLTGSKEGCAEGECGACAVAFVTRDAHGRARYSAVNSCLVPLGSVDGQTVVTVEGIARSPEQLHPVQQALIERGGSQCGYCTPGFVVSMFCEYYRPDRTTFDAESIAGNLCRCTGYRPILEAGRGLPSAAADDPQQPQLVSLRTPRTAAATRAQQSRELQSFVRPSSLPELFRSWSQQPDATLIAGATDLMVDANQRGTRFGTLLSLEAIDELARFELGERELTIGAGLTLSALEQHLERTPSAPPLLTALLPLFSSRLIRNRATLGGNLQTASPIGDAAPCLLALDAELSLSSEHGVRRLPLADFFVGYRKTALRSRELIASVHVPLPQADQQRFYKVGKRMLDDISTVAGAFALALDADGRVARLRIAYGGVAALPLRATAVEQLALHEPWSEQTLAKLIAALAHVGTPQSDHRGSAAYRRDMMARLLEKFWWATREQASTP